MEKAVKLSELEMLQCSAAVGEIDLFYLDESGFSLWMPTSYSYFFSGEQKRVEQTKHKGRRLSILGLIQPLGNFLLWGRGTLLEETFISDLEILGRDFDLGGIANSL